MSRFTPATLLGEFLGRLRRCPGWLWRLEARFKGVEFAGRCDFLGRPLISVERGSRMVLGDGVKIFSSLRANPLACFQPCVLRAMTPGATLILGPRVGLSATALCAARSIEVGEGTIMGAGAAVVDTDFHHPVGEWGWDNHFAAGAQPVKIGRGVFIGARALILKGVQIGDRAVVGAGAVVYKNVPAGHTVVGNPARSIGLAGALDR